MDDYLTSKEVLEIIRHLEGVNEEAQERICKELGVPVGLAMDVMLDAGYELNDVWEKIVPVRWFPKKQA